jgi:hypothetical protein
MTTDPPPPGSPWATHCPDAYPAEWLDALGLSALPAGFTRFATADESALITGALAPAEFVGRTGRAPRNGAPSPMPRRGTRASKSEGRFAVLNRFVDVELRDLTRAAVAVWLVLYRDTKPDGTARTGQADIARRAGLTPRGVRKALAELNEAALVEVVRRGRLGSGPSAYRVRGASRDGRT